MFLCSLCFSITHFLDVRNVVFKTQSGGKEKDGAKSLCHKQGRASQAKSGVMSQAKSDKQSRTSQVRRHKLQHTVVKATADKAVQVLEIVMFE